MTNKTINFGTLSEGMAFPFSVVATSSTGGIITYNLLSGTLPPGTTLNLITGDITGIVGHVSKTTVFNFTIRAQSGSAFADQPFSVTISARYTTGDIVTVAFKTRMQDSTAMTTYYNSIIQFDQYFRPYDSNFGVMPSNNTNIYLIGGLNTTASGIISYIQNSNYTGPISLTMGDHALAYAKVGGKVIYEVLYRPIYDPLDGAAASVVSVIGSTSTTVYPPSLNNIRTEFANNIGIPATNTNYTNSIGLNTSENLPLWMISPQVHNDPTTIIGFIPALVVAYLKPGTGVGILNQILARSPVIEGLDDPSNSLSNGHELDFDQYFVISQTMAPTSFDDSFDDTTTMDQDLIIVNNYYRMNLG